MHATALIDLMRADLGTAETVGDGSNPAIMASALRVSRAHPDLRWIASWYTDDDIPWCGLQLADVVVKAGLLPPRPNPLSARAWADWHEDAGGPRFGVVAVLRRPGGKGHVGLVEAVSPSGKWIRLIGGNQGNAVSVAWFEASRVITYRRVRGTNPSRAPVAPFKGDGVSTNEA